MTGTPTQNAVHAIRRLAGNPHRHPATRQALLAIADMSAGVTQPEALPAPPSSTLDGRPWCRDCGPGYHVGDEGCRHGEYQPELGEPGVCRTCAQPIWWESGEIGHRARIGWSDRIKRGGDSVVCFRAADYRHVPMGGREAAIYKAGVKAGQTGGGDRG